MKKYFEFGPLFIEINGSKDLIDTFFKSYFPYTKNNIEKIPDVVFNLLDKDNIEKNKYDFKSGNLAFSTNSFYGKDIGFNYRITDLFSLNLPTIVEIQIIKRRKQILFPVFDLLYAFFFSRDFYIKKKRMVNNILSYHLFLAIIAISLNKKDSGFIHASVIEKEKNGILIASTGGGGKTSTAFSFLNEQDTKFLAEDFAIIHKSGRSYYSPKPMAIYNSDLQYNSKILQDFKKKNLKFLHKIQWYLFSLRSNPRIKISPLNVFPKGKISNSVKITHAFFLIRSFNEEEIKLKEIEDAEFISRALSATFRELNFLYEIYTQLNSLYYQEKNLLNYNKLIDRYKKIFEESLQKAKKFLITVPIKYPPEEIKNLIQNILIKEEIELK